MTRPLTGRPGFPRSVLAAGLTAAFVLGACGGGTSSPSPSRSGASVAPAPSTAPVSASAAAATPATSTVSQTDTDWGRIWDTLPAGFPVIPGSTPSEEAAHGPASATFTVEGDGAQAIASSMRSALEGAGFTADGMSGPLEDGSFVLDMTGSPAGCMVQLMVTPRGGVTIVTILYGALCPRD